jgi:formylglycine-generating enzyme required for sulfatase activity
VWLDDYWIQATEVTVEQYLLCLASGACASPGQGPGCHTSAGREGELADHPANCVTWAAADAWCRWAGMKLCTEAQWEKAARGVDDSRLYPWGDEPPRCGYAAVPDREAVDSLGCAAVGPRPVGGGLRGISPYGARDQVGNVMEWTADWYRAVAYTDDATGEVRNPVGAPWGTHRSVRGSSFAMWEPELHRVTWRRFSDPSNQDPGIGFRCCLVANASSGLAPSR